jgi:hypothetical protein
MMPPTEAQRTYQQSINPIAWKRNSPKFAYSELSEVQPPSMAGCQEILVVPQCVPIIPGASGLQYPSATPFHIPHTGALFTQVREEKFSELRL